MHVHVTALGQRLYVLSHARAKSEILTLQSWALQDSKELGMGLTTPPWKRLLSRNLKKQ
jgi:hypothetical protein